MPSSKPPKSTFLHARVSPEFKERLRSIAKKHGKGMSAMLEELLSHYEKTTLPSNAQPRKS